MKNWQKSRNYRRVKDEHGDVVGHIITVDGQDVEVTEKVFLAYSQADRRERYITEEIEPGRVLSWELLLENDVPLTKLGVEPEKSSEDRLLELEDARRLAKRKALLSSALRSLDDADRQLIYALFFQGVSTRDYAAQIGVWQTAVVKRRDRILRDMKKYFEKFANEGCSLPGCSGGGVRG